MFSFYFFVNNSLQMERGDKMKMPKYSFENAKHLVVKNVGNEVYFKSKVARGKYYEDKGRITAAYKNIFTVKTTHNGKEELLTFT